MLSYKEKFRKIDYVQCLANGLNHSMIIGTVNNQLSIA